MFDEFLEFENFTPVGNPSPQYSFRFQSFLESINPMEVFSSCSFTHNHQRLTLSFIRGEGSDPFKSPMFKLDPSPFNKFITFHEVIDLLADPESPKMYCPWGLLIINERHRERIFRQIQADMSDLYLAPEYNPLADYLFNLFRILPGYSAALRTYRAAFRYTRSPQGALSLLIDYGNVPDRLKKCRTADLMSIERMDIDTSNETFVVEFADPSFTDLNLRLQSAIDILKTAPSRSYPHERFATLFGAFYNLNNKLLNIPGTVEGNVIPKLITIANKKNLAEDKSFIQDYAYTKRRPLVIPLEDFWRKPIYETPLEEWIYTLKINDCFTLSDAAKAMGIRKELIQEQIKSLVSRKRIASVGYGAQRRYRVLF